MYLLTKLNVTSQCQQYLIYHKKKKKKKNGIHLYPNHHHIHGIEYHSSIPQMYTRKTGYDIVIV